MGNADDTADSTKPVSTTQQAALDLKENLASKGAVSGYAGLGSDSRVPAAQLPVIPTWQAYVPVITAQTGAWSNVTLTGLYRVVNKILEVSFKVVFNGATTTAATMYISLPPGQTIDTAALAGGGDWDTDPAGFAILGDSGTVSGVPGIINTRTPTTVIVKYSQDGGLYIKGGRLTQAEPWVWANGDTVVGRFTVPII